MQFFLSVGMYLGGCLMLVGLLSVCTIIGFRFGTELIWIGLLIVVAFGIARQLFRESS